MSRAIASVFAHPDDETYAAGATLARYAAEGARLSLYCATDGDAGKSSGIPVSSSAELGSIRRAELHAACEVLGIARVSCGGRPDGALARADLDVIIGEIVAMIRRERPDVVLTFGPEGAPTQHTDHRAICRLATSAYLLAGTASAYPEQLAGGALEPHRPARLCYVTWPAPASGDRYQTEGQPVHLCLDARPWNARKTEAFERHRSQHVHRDSFLAHALTDEECFFVAAGTAMPEGATDLFDGL